MTSRPRYEIRDALDALEAVCRDIGKRGYAEGDEYRDARARVEELFDNQRRAAIDNADWFEQTNERRKELESEVARLREDALTPYEALALSELEDIEELGDEKMLPPFHSALFKLRRMAARSSTPDTPK